MASVGFYNDFVTIYFVMPLHSQDCDSNSDNTQTQTHTHTHTQTHTNTHTYTQGVSAVYMVMPTQSSWALGRHSESVQGKFSWGRD